MNYACYLNAVCLSIQLIEFSNFLIVGVIRLGEVDKALYHYKHAGTEAEHVDMAKAKSVQFHLNKCTEAKRLRDWNTLIKETGSAISAGADSAPQVS